MEAAKRRQQLVAKVSGGGDGSDKRSRPTATASTKVTPEGKKTCHESQSSERSESIEPRALSFSEADIPGDNKSIWKKSIPH